MPKFGGHNTYFSFFPRPALFFLGVILRRDSSFSINVLFPRGRPVSTYLTNNAPFLSSLSSNRYSIQSLISSTTKLSDIHPVYTHVPNRHGSQTFIAPGISQVDLFIEVFIVGGEASNRLRVIDIKNPFYLCIYILLTLSPIQQSNS